MAESTAEAIKMRLVRTIKNQLTCYLSDIL